jgi:hypothetical protein
MARRGRRGGRARVSGIANSFRGLVEAIADKVVTRVQKQLPGRDQLKGLERQVRSLTRRIETGASRSGVRRVGRPRSHRKCQVPGCGLPHVAQGFCSRHYQAWRRRKLQRAGRRARRTARDRS